MQRPAELVPIPERGVKASEGSVKAPESWLHFGKIPKKIGQNLAKFSNILAKLRNF